MSLPYSRLSETSFSILSRQYQCNALIEPGLRRSGWFVDHPGPAEVAEARARRSFGEWLLGQKAAVPARLARLSCDGPLFAWAGSTFTAFSLTFRKLQCREFLCVMAFRIWGRRMSRT